MFRSVLERQVILVAVASKAAGAIFAAVVVVAVVRAGKGNPGHPRRCCRIDAHSLGVWCTNRSALAYCVLGRIKERMPRSVLAQRCLDLVVRGDVESSRVFFFRAAVEPPEDFTGPETTKTYD